MVRQLEGWRSKVAALPAGGVYTSWCVPCAFRTPRCMVAARHQPRHASSPPGQALHKGHVAAGEERHRQWVHLDPAVPQQDDPGVLGQPVELPLVALPEMARRRGSKAQLGEHFTIAGRVLAFAGQQLGHGIERWLAF